jgi:hypothetical protein
MSLLLQEMVIASSAKFLKNKKLQKNINYMPLVYEKFKIDSTRFNESNYYYMSTVDQYQEILENAAAKLESRKNAFQKIKKNADSLKEAITDTEKKNKLDRLKIKK